MWKIPNTKFLEEYPPKEQPSSCYAIWCIMPHFTLIKPLLTSQFDLKEIYSKKDYQIIKAVKSKSKIYIICIFRPMRKKVCIFSIETMAQNIPRLEFCTWYPQCNATFWHWRSSTRVFYFYFSQQLSISKVILTLSAIIKKKGSQNLGILKTKL